MRSISTVQRPMPRTAVSRSTIASSSMRASCASVGISPATARAARSFRLASFAAERPAARSRRPRREHGLRVEAAAGIERAHATEDGRGGAPRQLLVDDRLGERRERALGVLELEPQRARPRDVLAEHGIGAASVRTRGVRVERERRARSVPHRRATPASTSASVPPSSFRIRSFVTSPPYAEKPPAPPPAATTR